MITLNESKADPFVTKLQGKGVQVKWVGWDMVFLTPSPKAIHSKSGRRWDAQWGFETSISPNTEGNWLVEHRLTRGANA